MDAETVVVGPAAQYAGGQSRLGGDLHTLRATTVPVSHQMAYVDPLISTVFRVGTRDCKGSFREKRDSSQAKCDESPVAGGIKTFVLGHRTEIFTCHSRQFA